MNIHQKIREVMKVCAYVQKDATVSAGGGREYMAVSHDQVTAVVRPHFVEQGIVIRPTLVSSRITETGKTDKGLAIIRYSGTFDVSFINVDDPADRETMRVEADADDRGDKAPGKALSYATKYAILKALMLETGEGDEARVVPGVGLDETIASSWLAMIAAAPTKDALEPVKTASFKAARDAHDLEAHASFKAAVLKRLDDLKAPAKDKASA